VVLYDRRGRPPRPQTQRAHRESSSHPRHPMSFVVRDGYQNVARRAPTSPIESPPERAMPRTRLYLAAFVTTLMAASTPAAARPLVVEDYYRLITVQAPAMSPDGRWIAFVRSSIVEADNRRQSESWMP